MVLTTAERSDVHALSLPASAAWLLLDRPRTLSEIADALADEFEVGRPEIDERVAGLVAELESAGWLVRGGGS